MRGIRRDNRGVSGESEREGVFRGWWGVTVWTGDKKVREGGE